MPVVKFTKNLQRFFPDLQPHEVSSGTVADLVDQLDREFPGLAGYIVDDQGALRHHVNIFVNGELIHDKKFLQDPLNTDDEVYIIQALSGG
ncbi:MAG: MoaD/ThiS family protein [Anaerolineales bacterium]|nr:MoaD/ThiS family protein [Anaerolineales bacterium]